MSTKKHASRHTLQVCCYRMLHWFMSEVSLVDNIYVSHRRPQIKISAHLALTYNANRCFPEHFKHMTKTYVATRLQH